MTSNSKRPRMTVYLSALLATGVAQDLYAHAGFKQPLMEGVAGSKYVSSDNAVTITHGCNSNKGGEANGQPHRDVIALSVLFPDFTDTSKVIIRQSAGTVPPQSGNAKTTPTGTGTQGDEFVMPDLSHDIVNATNTLALPASLTLDLGGDQLFANTIPIVDAKGNVRGWQGWSGPRPVRGPVLLESFKKPDGTEVSTTGFSPFRLSNTIQFQPTSCAKKLQIRVAVANWCLKGKSSYHRPDRADIWIGSMTSKFNDPELMPNASVENGGSGAIFWPTLTINRDLAKNPVPSSCTSSDYDTVYIEPKPEDIDTYLPISSARYPKGAGEKYWPTP
ncbi:conserved protein of unknown function [Candidatus Methylocalor cossyra]|uniref:Uncharacterized protein n=2 Tax=Candidatus Methylocalor cossyra TaxID=3108543 RepID=A0ABM9NL31_9GAMM